MLQQASILMHQPTCQDIDMIKIYMTYSRLINHRNIRCQKYNKKTSGVLPNPLPIAHVQIYPTTEDAEGTGDKDDMADSDDMGLTP
jgi:hypothetical protein